MKDKMVTVVIYVGLTLLTFLFLAWYYGEAQKAADKCARQGGRWTEITKENFGCVGAKQ